MPGTRARQALGPRAASAIHLERPHDRVPAREVAVGDADRDGRAERRRRRARRPRTRPRPSRSSSVRRARSRAGGGRARAATKSGSTRRPGGNALEDRGQPRAVRLSGGRQTERHGTGVYGGSRRQSEAEPGGERAARRPPRRISDRSIRPWRGARSVRDEAVQRPTASAADAYVSSGAGRGSSPARGRARRRRRRAGPRRRPGRALRGRRRGGARRTDADDVVDELLVRGDVRGPPKAARACRHAAAIRQSTRQSSRRRGDGTDPAARFFVGFHRHGLSLRSAGGPAAGRDGCGRELPSPSCRSRRAISRSSSALELAGEQDLPVQRRERGERRAQQVRVLVALILRTSGRLGEAAPRAGAGA